MLVSFPVIAGFSGAAFCAAMASGMRIRNGVRLIEAGNCNGRYAMIFLSWALFLWDFSLIARAGGIARAIPVAFALIAPAMLFALLLRTKWPRQYPFLTIVTASFACVVQLGAII